MESVGNHTTTNFSPFSIGSLDGVAEGFSASLFYVAAVTVLVYDTLLTLDEEWICIWRSIWSVTKCIFFVVRYLPLPIQAAQMIANFASAAPSDSICSLVKWAKGVEGIVLEATADIYLLYRVFAFCGRNKYLFVGLILIYIGAQTASFSLLGVLTPDYIVITSPAVPLRPLLGNCIHIHYSFKITLDNISLFSQHSCLLFKVVYEQYGVWCQGQNFSQLYVVFIRDGIWAYFLIVVSLILCVVSAYKAQQFNASFITWLFTVTSVYCCRLILNLRSVAYKNFKTEIHQEDSGVLSWEVAINPLVESTTNISTAV